MKDEILKEEIEVSVSASYVPGESERWSCIKFLFYKIKKLIGI